MVLKWKPFNGSSYVLSLQITLQRRVSCSVVHYCCQRSAVPVCRRMNVSQLTKPLCCLTSDLLAPILRAASLMSFNGLLCGHPAGGIRRLQRTQAPWCLDLLPGIPREVCRQVLKDLLVRYRLGGSSNDCLSKEKTGSSLESQDPVRALLIISVKLECSNWVPHLSQH